MKKGAIGLSINMLVIVILSIIILISGIAVVYNIFGNAEETQTKVNQQVQEDTERVLNEGKKVSLPFHTQTISRGDEHSFALGILNTGLRQDFAVQVGLSKIISANIMDLSDQDRYTISQKLLLYNNEPISLEHDGYQRENILVSIPSNAPGGQYIFKAVVVSKNTTYGTPQIIYVTVEGSGDITSLLPKEEEEEEEDCLTDLTCDIYYVFVPINGWTDQALFTAQTQERAEFFIDITPLKFKKVGTIAVPLSYLSKCQVNQINARNPSHHLRIKDCADTYTAQLGVDYEKVVGLSNSFDAGWTFFNSKVAYAGRGYTLAGNQLSNRPGIVAHELGHTYFLCDEYSFTEYSRQDRFLKNIKCQNTFPTDCSKTQNDCLGNTPTLRDYSGTSVQNVCFGSQHFSVMGFSTGQECGFDQPGYAALGKIT